MFSDIAKRISRYHEFYRKEEPALLLHVRCMDKADPAAKEHYLKKLWHGDYHKAKDRQELFDGMLDEVLEENKLHPLADDYLPSGKIVWGSVFSIIIKDRPINVQEHSSWIEHCLVNLDDLDSLQFKLDETNFWWQLYKDAKLWLLKHLEYVTPVYHQGILDLAWDLRGNDLYTDFYTDPEKALRLVEFCTGSLIRIGDAARAIRSPNAPADFWVGGWGFNALVPGCGGITTCDTSCQLSPEFFATFEAPFMEKIQRHAPGYLLHTHSVGARHQKACASLEGINIMQMVSDPNVTPPAENMGEILERVGMKPLLITTTPEAIRRNIGALKRGRIIIRANAANIREAEELLAFVRRHSRISD